MNVQLIIKNQLFQRISYSIGLLIWISLMIDTLREHPFSESSVGVSYLTLFIIPACILLIQIILNHRLLWFLIFALYASFYLITLFRVIADTIERSGNHVKAIPWSIEIVAFMLLGWVLLTLVGLFIYKLKPE